MKCILAIFKLILGIGHYSWGGEVANDDKWQWKELKRLGKKPFFAKCDNCVRFSAACKHFCQQGGLLM